MDLDPVPEWLFTSIAVDGNGDPADGNVISTGVWDPIDADYTGATGNDASLPGAADGGQAAYLYLSQDGSGDVVPLLASLTTSDAVAVIASSTRYDLAVAVGNSKLFEPGSVTIELLAGSQVVASAAANAATVANGAFANLTASFTTLASDPLEGDDLRVRLAHTFNSTGTREVEFDNIRLESTFIPEPASMATVLLAAAGFVRRRRSMA